MQDEEVINIGGTQEVKPSATLEALYVKDELHIVVIQGVEFKMKELTGKEFTRVADRCIIHGQEDIDKVRYTVELLKAVVVEPQGIDFDRLKPSVMSALLAEAEDFLGLTEMAQKK